MSDKAERGVPYFDALDGGAMLVLGCERTPLGIVVGAGIGPLYVAFFAMFGGSFAVALTCAGIGSAVLFGGVYALRRMAKADPMLVRLYLRNRKYQRHYPARSSRYCHKDPK